MRQHLTALALVLFAIVEGHHVEKNETPEFTCHRVVASRTR